MKSRRFATKHGAIEASVRSLPGPDDVPRILTYNVHRCIGMDGHLSPQRIANVIAPCRPDIVCLQELDVGRVRTRGVDQAHAIARELGMHMLFHALPCRAAGDGGAVRQRRPHRPARGARQGGAAARRSASALCGAPRRLVGLGRDRRVAAPGDHRVDDRRRTAVLACSALRAAAGAPAATTGWAAGCSILAIPGASWAPRLQCISVACEPAVSPGEGRTAAPHG